MKVSSLSLHSIAVQAQALKAHLPHNQKPRQAGQVIFTCLRWVKEVTTRMVCSGSKATRTKGRLEAKRISPSTKTMIPLWRRARTCPNLTCKWPTRTMMALETTHRSRVTINNSSSRCQRLNMSLKVESSLTV